MKKIFASLLVLYLFQFCTKTTIVSRKATYSSKKVFNLSKNSNKKPDLIYYQNPNYVVKGRHLLNFFVSTSLGAGLGYGLGNVLYHDGSKDPKTQIPYTQDELVSKRKTALIAIGLAGTLNGVLTSFLVGKKKYTLDNSKIIDSYEDKLRKNNKSLEDYALLGVSKQTNNIVFVKKNISQIAENLNCLYFGNTYSRYSENLNNDFKIAENLKSCKYYNYELRKFVDAKFDGDVNSNGFPVGKGTIYTYYKDNGNYFPFGRAIKGNLINGKFEGFTDDTFNGSSRDFFPSIIVSYKDGLPHGEGLISFSKPANTAGVFVKYIVANYINGIKKGKAVAYDEYGNVVASGDCNDNCVLKVPFKIDEEDLLIAAGLVIAADFLIHHRGKIFNLGDYYKGRNTEGCEGSFEIDPECDGYECFYYVCNKEGNGRIIRIEQISEYKYKVGAGDQIEYATSQSEAQSIAKKLTDCNCN